MILYSRLGLRSVKDAKIGKLETEIDPELLYSPHTCSHLTPHLLLYYVDTETCAGRKVGCVITFYCMGKFRKDAELEKQLLSHSLMFNHLEM